MRFISFARDNVSGIAIKSKNDVYLALDQTNPKFPGDLTSLIKSGGEALTAARRSLETHGFPLDLTDCILLPPIAEPEKIICVGLNYVDHSHEAGFEVPDYPTLFARFRSSLIGHGAPIRRPNESEQLDYEGELVAVVGREGRRIPKGSALAHVAGYTVFNDATLRDYQFRTPQWTMGKNFDETGAIGPQFVTADELPPGAVGLRIQTRLNDVVVQNANTSQMVFDVATLIALISDAMTLRPGDLIVTGTPSGIGMARKPPLWMKPGDVCEVEIEQIGVLRNPIEKD
ncbi:fumarylacetoacetate hydrolase [Paraburkholderia phytofirmans OLGA172]|uniref:Fumarylacetoacetate hydrolase n=1 Tax=Paraburkholderia phytofirmans OLGA172 TaxID=1417228 RepID=A0A160FU14_9BURK|nr:fumarylacetoacetate hydrolase family protein [Paraburkholderia phytofirmans]ANB76356.1 fumarylacetoacetate hydrolase [Paraburkholderia phytofirmans OLGA172]